MTYFCIFVMIMIFESPWLPHIIEGGCTNCLLNTRYMGTESIRLSMYGLESISVFGVPYNVYQSEYILPCRAKANHEVYREHPVSDLEIFNLMLESLGYDKLQNPGDTIAVTWDANAIERPIVMPRRVFGFKPINVFSHCEGMHGEYTRLVFTNGNNASSTWTV